MSFVTNLFKKPKIRRQPLETGLTANPPRKLVIGKTANGGDFVFKGLSDYETDDNRDYSIVIVLAGHKCNRLTRVWADGELVHGELVNGVRTAIDDFQGDGRADRPRLFLTYHDGSPNQAADAFLANTFIRPTNWDLTARLRGCAYVVATMRHDTKVLSSELAFRFEYEGANLYDRRKDTTAGGSGTHRLNDPSTWQYTDNAAVALDHYRLGIVGGENNDKVIFGMGQAVWQNPYDEFEANADICDEQVFGLSRYAFNGRISAEEDHSEVIQRFAKQMAARAYYSGGRLYVRPKQTRPIKITLYDSDLVADADYELSVSPGGDDLTNTIKGAFSDPQSMYDKADYPDIADAALIASDGRIFEDTLDLSDEVNEARAQRIATIELEIQKRRDQITETFMPIANVLEIGDWYDRVSNLRGAVTKTYEVVDLERGRGDGHRVKVTGQETDSAVTAFGENQAIPIARPAPLPPLELLTPPAPDVAAQALIDTSGGASLPSITFTVTPPTGDTFDGVAYFEVQYGFSNGLTGDDLGIKPGEINFAQFDNSERFDLPVKSIIPNAVYAYRVRTISNELPSEWGPFKEIVSSPVLISTDTAAVAGVDSAAVLADIDSRLDAQDGAQIEADAIAEAQARIDTARTDLEQADTQLGGAIDGLDTRLGTAEGEVSSQGSRLTTVETTTTDQGTRLNAVETESSDSQSRVATLETTTADQGERLTTVETKSSDSQSRVATLETTTSDQGQRLTTVETASADSQSRVSTLEQTSVTQGDRITGVEAEATAASIRALNASVGTNLLPNSRFLQDEPWDFTPSSGATDIQSYLPVGNSRAIAGDRGVRIFQPDANAGTSSDARSPAVPVQEGVVYVAAIYTGVQRCQVELRIQWNSATAILGYGFVSATCVTTGNEIGGTKLDDFQRLWIAEAAPVGAVSANIRVTKEGTSSGSNSFAFLGRPSIAEGELGQTAPGPWSEGSVESDIVEVQTAIATETQSRTLAVTQLESDVNGVTSRVTTAEGTLVDVDGRTQAYIEQTTETSDGGATIVRARSVGALGQIVIGGQEVVLVVLDANGDITQTATAMKFQNGLVQIVNAELNATTITAGALRRSVALAPDFDFGTDGDSISFGGTVARQPDITFDISSLPALAAGDRYEAKAVNRTLTGFDVSLKELRGGGTVTVTDTGDVSGGTNRRTMDKTDTRDAPNYKMRLQGTIEILSIPNSNGFNNTTVLTFISEFDDGTGFEDGPSMFVTNEDVGIASNTTTDESGTYNYDVTRQVTWGNAIGQHGGDEFGARLDTGNGTFTDLESVTYTVDTGSVEVAVTTDIPITIQHYQA